MIDNGFRSNICKLRFTVGCCEKTMANKIKPANPSVVNSVASINQNGFFRLSSSNANTNISSAIVLKIMIGLMSSHMSVLVSV